MLIAGKIDGIIDLLHLLWVSARGLTMMGVSGYVVLALIGAALSAGLWYFLVRSREA